MKEKIEQWYIQRLWSKSMVMDAVGRIITKEEAENIITKRG